MKHLGEAPTATSEVVRRPVPSEQATAMTPPEDQRFFDEALEVSLRGVRRLIEKRRKTH